MKFFRKLPAETREACDLVTLGHKNIDRQTHAQNLLRLPEFLVKTVRLLLEFGAAFVSQPSITNEIRSWNRQHQTIERPLRPVFLQQPQDRIPTAVARRSVRAQHEIARDVEHDALIEEVPVQLPVVLIGQVLDRDVETVEVE